MLKKGGDAVEELQGLVEHIIFESKDGAFTVFRLKTDEGIVVTATAKQSAPLPGEELKVQGQWVEHVRFGRQLQVVACEVLPPSSLKGIERFLASGAIKGIGPSLAKRLISEFGKKTLAIIEREPHKLLAVEGIGKKKAELMHQSYVEQAELREIKIFLETYGIGGGYAARIGARYGSDALRIIKNNPYRLAKEVSGIGFRIADRIALALGFEKNDERRLAAGLEFALYQAAQSGHACLPETVLASETAKLLQSDPFETATELRQRLRNGDLCFEETNEGVLVYPQALYEAECRICERLKELQKKAPVLNRPIHLEELGRQMELAAAQAEALDKVLAHGVLILTGGPGTGKTTTVKSILAVLDQLGQKVLLGAPTGRAAKRLAEATGREAMTLHRLLEASGSEGSPFFARCADKPLDADAVIVDEVSMMDLLLSAHLLDALPNGCRLVLVGDVDQLPSVGPGTVLRDLLRSDVLPVVRLTEIFRQAQQSPIVRNAHHINRGLALELTTEGDFSFLPVESSVQAAERIVRLCLAELPDTGYDVLRDVQVLSPMHRFPCGVENLNRLLQEALNPPLGFEEVTQGQQIFRVGDKVMQTRNNYSKNVFNGDIGFIRWIEQGLTCVAYPEGDVVYGKDELEELMLSYAMSVHKSQGSEYAVVIIPLLSEHAIMLQRNLLYTAVTRAKERVILIGSRRALNTALANERTRKRYSLLAERLNGLC